MNPGDLFGVRTAAAVGAAGPGVYLPRNPKGWKPGKALA
jgi:hypothetical protein